ncbi:MAG: hypothetical protein GY937_22470 [bacterium]|nr:hypothetical protein [bacterium]
MAKEPLVTLDLGNEVVRSFPSAESLRKWVDELWEAWSWVQPVAGSDGNLGPLRDPFNRLLTAKGILDAHAEEEIQPAELGQVRDHLNHALQDTKRRLLLEDTYGQAVLSVRGEDTTDHQAAWLLFFLIHSSQTPAPNQANQLVAYSMFNALRFAPTENEGIAAVVALRNALADWNRERTEGHESLKELRGEFRGLVSAFEESNTAQAREHVEMRKFAEARLEEMEDQFKRRMSLEGPISYWDEKAKTHRKRTWWFVICTATASVLAASMVFFAAKWLFIGDAPKAVRPSGDVHQWGLLMFLASIALSVWIVRVFHRMLMSNVHLRSDAEERVTMITTYLALAEDEGLGVRDRLDFMLASIFRPTTTGVVKEEGPAGSVVGEMLQLTRRSRPS